MSSNYLLHALNMAGGQRNRRFWLMAGAWFLWALPIASQSAWGTWSFWSFERNWPMVILCATAFLVSAEVVSRLHLLPRSSGWGVVFLCFTLSFLAVVFIVAFGRLYYSRTFLVVIYPLSLLIILVGCRKGNTGPLRTMALVPGGQGEVLLALKNFKWLSLQEPKLNDERGIYGVVVDLHQSLSHEWSVFLSECALKRIPVYHSAVIFEDETGRASMPHFSENLIRVVQGAEVFARLKRIVDVLIIVTSLPLWLPVFTLVAVAIKLTSRGPVFFWQERIGQGENTFKMVKFRSMNVSSEDEGSSFASLQDDRVTSVGKFIRKFRLDELPQFWNVLKGEMSLIGPRPEQVDFVTQFKKEIPYYAYRHVVKPGITGWAQVNHGYASDKISTQHKVEYDLFYIKHLSFWLDFLILIKTFHIILTGYGAR